MMDGNKIELFNLLNTDKLTNNKLIQSTDTTIFSDVLSHQLEEDLDSFNLKEDSSEEIITEIDISMEQNEVDESEDELSRIAYLVNTSVGTPDITYEKITIPKVENSLFNIKDEASHQSEFPVKESVDVNSFMSLNSEKMFQTNVFSEEPSIRAVQDTNKIIESSVQIESKEKENLNEQLIQQDFKVLDEKEPDVWNNSTEEKRHEQMESVLLKEKKEVNHSLTNDKNHLDYLLVNDSSNEDLINKIEVSKDFKNHLLTKEERSISISEEDIDGIIVDETKNESPSENSEREAEIDNPNNLMFVNQKFTEKEMVNSISKADTKEPIHQISEIKNLQEVTKTIISEANTMISEESKSFKLTLQPENLGRVEVMLEMKDGKLSTQFIVPNNQVKELLDNHLVNFQNSIVENKMTVDKLEVVINVANQNTFDLSGDLNHRQQQKQSSFKPNKLSQQYDKTEEFEEINLTTVNDTVNILV